MLSHAVQTRPPARSRPGPRPEAIRRYSLSWLMRAASRVYERGMAVDKEQRLSEDMSGLFDLTDAGQTGNFRRM